MKMSEKTYVALKRELEAAMTEWVCSHDTAIHASGHIMLRLKDVYEGRIPKGRITHEEIP